MKPLIIFNKGSLLPFLSLLLATKPDIFDMLGQSAAENLVYFVFMATEPVEPTQDLFLTTCFLFLNPTRPSAQWCQQHIIEHKESQNVNICGLHERTVTTFVLATGFK